VLSKTFEGITVLVRYNRTMKSYTTYTDEKLVSHIRTEQKEAYTEIVRRYEKKLTRYAMYLLHDSHIADDVVQQSFIKAYINLNGFNIQKSFSSWIYRIVHNEAINVIKKYKKEVHLFETSDFESSQDVVEDYSKKELTQMVKSCLEQMPIEYSEPLTLFSLEEKSYTEISDILRMPVSSVGTRIRRAKQLMKQICQRK